MPYITEKGNTETHITIFGKMNVSKFSLMRKSFYLSTVHLRYCLSVKQDNTEIFTVKFEKTVRDNAQTLRPYKKYVPVSACVCYKM